MSRSLVSHEDIILLGFVISVLFSLLLSAILEWVFRRLKTLTMPVLKWIGDLIVKRIGLEEEDFGSDPNEYLEAHVYQYIVAMEPSPTFLTLAVPPPIPPDRVDQPQTKSDSDEDVWWMPSPKGRHVRKVKPRKPANRQDVHRRLTGLGQE